MADIWKDARAVALVPVRSGSKGLPGKNIRPLAGVPLYAHAVAQGMRVVGACVVTTDISEILRAPVPEGCRLLRRPDALCGDDVAMDAVIADAITQLDLADSVVILLLQATSPLRTDCDVKAVLELHIAGRFDLVLSVTATDSGILKYGTLNENRFIPVGRPQFCFTNRQSLPRLFRPNGAVFAFSVGAFRRNGGLATDNIGAVEMSASRSVDIDTISDFLEIEARLNAIPGHKNEMNSNQDRTKAGDME
jgi:N-acylneuraminate cytidylyltransferase